MKKFVTLFVSCSLTFAVSAQAEQKNAKKKPTQQQSAPAHQQAVKQSAHVPHAQQMPAYNAGKMHGGNLPKQPHNVPSAYHPNKIYSGAINQPPMVHPNRAPVVHPNELPAVQSNKFRAPRNELPAVQSNKFPVAHPNQVPAGYSNKAPMVGQNQFPTVPSTTKAAAQNIRAQHANFHARPSTNVAGVQYNQNYRVTGAENWRGVHYDAFRSYHPVWHDRTWWHSNYSHVVLIGGGWYYWNAGYWYPAWGYDPAAAYYPYDGPIYVGETARPVDQVIADVQSILQEQGFYQGEVDGLLGPLTRDALASYQSEQGLEITAAIDQPTLEALGLG